MSTAPSVTDSATHPESSLRGGKRIIPWVVAFALFMETLDATIINTAIPQIARSMGESAIELKAALICYLLSLAIFIPISGWAADRYGMRRVFSSAILVFTLGSICCGMAPTLYALAASRCLQGIGGAMMMPVGRLILLRSFPKSELVRATNYATIPALVGPAMGPVVGGAIVTYVSWRWVFLINVPIGLMGAYFVRKYINEQLGEKRDLDFVGFVLFGTGLAGLSYGVETLREVHLSSFIETFLIIASVACLIAYFVHARRSTHPLINIHLFQIRTFRIAVLGGLISRMGIGGIPFLLPLFFQLGLGLSPLHAGLLIFPISIAMLLMKFYVQRILQRIGFRRALVFNTLLLGLSILPFTLITQQSPAIAIIAIVFTHGLVSSLQFSCMNVLSYTDIDVPRFSMATSIGSATTQLAMSLGVGLSAAVLDHVGNASHPGALNGRVDAFHTTFVIISCVTVLSTLLFVRLRDDDGAATSGYVKHAAAVHMELPAG